MEDLIWKIISGLGAIMAGYMMFTSFLQRQKDNVEDEKVEQVKANNDLELKVKELELKISTQYSELKTQLLGLERAIAEDKAAKTIFENRILGSVDKIDVKMERIQDLVLRVFVTNNQQK